MTSSSLAPSLEDEIAPGAARFYRSALQALHDAGIPFLVGGAFAHACHTGIRRATKDLDLFIHREHYERIADCMQQRGWRTEMAFPHWLAKVYEGPEYIDLIFNSGNGVARVDAQWFQQNLEADVLGVPVAITNVEDCLLSRAFVMERERYDGGDVAHLLQAHAERIDWQRVLDRFGAHWRVLLAHLTLFGYIYPGERHRLPSWVMAQLVARLADETRHPPEEAGDPVCAGTLLSREQYLHDVRALGYIDGRLTPASSMTPEDVSAWTEAIQPKEAPSVPDLPPPPAEPLATRAALP